MLDAKESIGIARLILTDITGRIAYNRNITVAKGMNVFAINTTDLPTGNYILTVNNENIMLSQKIVVTH
jgi:hypothetical protein